MRSTLAGDPAKSQGLHRPSPPDTQGKRRSRNAAMRPCSGPHPSGEGLVTAGQIHLTSSKCITVMATDHGGPHCPIRRVRRTEPVTIRSPRRQRSTRGVRRTSLETCVPFARSSRAGRRRFGRGPLSRRSTGSRATHEPSRVHPRRRARAGAGRRVLPRQRRPVAAGCCGTGVARQGCDDLDHAPVPGRRAGVPEVPAPGGRPRRPE